MRLFCFFVSVPDFNVSTKKERKKQHKNEVILMTLADWSQWVNTNAAWFIADFRFGHTPNTTQTYARANSDFELLFFSRRLSHGPSAFLSLSLRTRNRGRVTQYKCDGLCDFRFKFDSLTTNHNLLLFCDIVRPLLLQSAAEQTIKNYHSSFFFLSQFTSLATWLKLRITDTAINYFQW